MSFHEMVNLGGFKILRKKKDFILEMRNFRCIWFSQKETSRAESRTQRQRASPDTLFHCLLNISNLMGPKLVSFSSCGPISPPSVFLIAVKGITHPAARTKSWIIPEASPT